MGVTTFRPIPPGPARGVRHLQVARRPEVQGLLEAGQAERSRHARRPRRKGNPRRVAPRRQTRVLSLISKRIFIM